MSILTQALELLGPTLVGIITVPLMSGVKYVAHFIDRWPAWGQQLGTVGIAFGLSQLGVLTNTILPDAFHLFTDADMSALISSGMAFAIHAGKKQRAQ